LFEVWPVCYFNVAVDTDRDCLSGLQLLKVNLVELICLVMLILALNPFDFKLGLVCKNDALSFQQLLLDLLVNGFV